MVRFIDIRGQGTGSRFSFWDTVSDRYISVCDEMAWESWVDFENDYNTSPSGYSIDRLKGLCPEWVNDGKEDDIEKFYGDEAQKA